MINVNNSAIKTKGNDRLVPYALIFDVDGVLTDPSAKKVTEQGLFSQFIKRLEAGEPLILNTGRAVDFIIEKIFEPLEKLVADKKLLKSLFAVGEKGAVSVQYNNTGERIEYVDQSISVPESLQTEVRQIVERKFSDIAFYDATKKTMISIEMLDGLSVDEFRKRQVDLDKELDELLTRHGLTSGYKVDPTRIATDVENNHVGKGLGVQKALKWLAEQNIEPERFIAFGDSLSDVDMAHELQQHGLPVEFVLLAKKRFWLIKDLNFLLPIQQGDVKLALWNT